MSKKAESSPSPKAQPQAWQTGVIMRHRAHSTGMVDYDYWVYAFSGREPDPSAPKKPFRRGRIWA